MAEYYLISQLPSLDGISDTSPVPITEDRFLDLCGRFLGEKVLREITAITLLPSLQPETAGSALIESWNDSERNLRLALGKVRADKLNKPFDLQNKTLSADLYKVAGTAIEIENPLEAENYLLHHRLRVLEMLRPTDAFSEEFIFYYALKLKLILRIRQFDAERGEAVYKNFYDSIINGDRSEA